MCSCLRACVFVCVFTYSRCKAIDDLSWFPSVRFRVCRSLQQQDLWLKMRHLHKHIVIFPRWQYFIFPRAFQDAAGLFAFSSPNLGALLQDRCRVVVGWNDFQHAIDLNRHRRVLFEPISQLLNLSIHQSVESLYLVLLVRRNWHLSLSTKSLHHSSPSSSSAVSLLALDCCEVLSFFSHFLWGETLY